jgi:hypothetical protein
VSKVEQGGGARRLGWASRRLASRDVQMQLALLALDHWELLTPREQERFRALASDASQLVGADRRELRSLWKQLQIKRLLAESIHVLTARQKP